MNKPQRPEDFVLWQVSGALIGAAAGIAAVACSFVFLNEILAVVLVLFVPVFIVLGGVAGMFWGSRPRHD
jgi:hypothetical protein